MGRSRCSAPTPRAPQRPPGHPRQAAGAAYTALLESIGAREATKLHADEREQLLAVADALLFGDPDSEQELARALDLIARLQESERWSAESCAELREHLYGCGALPAGA